MRTRSLDHLVLTARDLVRADEGMTRRPGSMSMRGAARPRRPAPAAVALISVALAACRPSVQDPPSPPPPSSAPPGASTSTAAAPAPASASAAAPEEPPLPELPAIAQGTPGPAYVLVDHVGVLRIDNGDVATVLPISADTSTLFTSLVAGPTGEVWMSDWSGVRVIDPASGAVRSVRQVKDGPLYESLRVRSNRDAWAVTSDNEWALVRYDGKRWTEVRRRAQFPGELDDNKLDDLAVTSDAVWVSTWNGLWRGAGADWQRIEPPAGEGRALFLFTYRDRLIAHYLGGYFIRDGAGWRELGWPDGAGQLRAFSDIGLAAGWSPDRRRVVIGSVEGAGRIVTSGVMRGSIIKELSIDQSGRVWVVTDYALSVLDRAGRVVAEWTPGTLEGLTGQVARVAVVGAGPAKLPAPRPARSWEIVGRMQVYKRRAPLAGAALELCPEPDEKLGCRGSAFVRSATTGADGSFRFADVPDGDFRIHVRPPPTEQDCDGLFRIVGHSFAPARDCKPDPAAPLRCDLGPLTQCLPFEMPPPH